MSWYLTRPDGKFQHKTEQQVPNYSICGPYGTDSSDGTQLSTVLTRGTGMLFHDPMYPVGVGRLKKCILLVILAINL